MIKFKLFNFYRRPRYNASGVAIYYLSNNDPKVMKHLRKLSVDEHYLSFLQDESKCTKFKGGPFGMYTCASLAVMAEVFNTTAKTIPFDGQSDAPVGTVDWTTTSEYRPEPSKKTKVAHQSLAEVAACAEFIESYADRSLSSTAWEILRRIKQQCNDSQNPDFFDTIFNLFDSYYTVNLLEEVLKNDFGIDDSSYSRATKRDLALVFYKLVISSAGVLGVAAAAAAVSASSSASSSSSSAFGGGDHV